MARFPRCVYNAVQNRTMSRSATEAAVPELPEVETVVREVRPHLVGRTIAAVRVSEHELRQPWSPAWNRALTGQRILGVERRGKWIFASLSGGRTLVIHLGMTGQLTVVPARSALQPHTHVVFGLRGTEQQLRFRDVRRFGSVSVLDAGMSMEGYVADIGLGPEPFAVEAAYWRRQLAKTQRCLKAVLLDQRVVAGVGNIYADESLFAARLPPARLGRQTSGQEAGRLRRAIVQVLNRAIERRGSSIRDYVRGSGKRGEYQREFRVYGRTGEPCSRCRAPIHCIRLAGRSTHFCPQCQRLK